jgi:DNA repair photolyase
VLWQFRHPVANVTKSSRVERDIDPLGEMANEQLASVVVSVTTLDAELARKLQPGAPAPYRRLETIERLAHAGVPVGVPVVPVIPFLNDRNLEYLLEDAPPAGATQGDVW